MPAYLVALDRSVGGRTLRNDTDAMVVFAASAAQAKEVAHAAVPGDGNAWLSSTTTVTEIKASTNWDGWKFEVVIQSGLGAEGDQSGHVAVTGNGTTLDTMDKIGTALASALNDLDGIAGAAYTAADNTLTIADATDAWATRPCRFSSARRAVTQASVLSSAPSPMKVPPPTPCPWSCPLTMRSFQLSQPLSAKLARQGSARL